MSLENDNSTVLCRIETPQQQMLSQYVYVLNVDKVETLEDCKKILSFLCARILPTIPEGVEYNDFSEVRKYFD